MMNTLGTCKSNTFNKKKGTPFQQLLINKPPWGKYSASSWVSGTSTLTDETGNGRNALGAGTAMTQGTASGNGATVSIPYIQGVPASQLQWPAGSIPSQNTICFITRYATGSNQYRILTQSSANNTILGHHGSKGGVVYNGDGTGAGWKTNQVTTSPTTDWLNMCYTNSPTTTNPTPNNILVNGVGVGILGGNDGIVSRLAVNLYSGGEKSDFQLAQVLIWDQVLTPAEMVVVSNAYTQFLATGILS